jgi:hypothetical protein
MRVLPAIALVLLSLAQSTLLRAQPPADSRQPIPAPHAVQAAETLMKEVFAAELAKRSQADMKALAAKLLAEAAENQADPASQYVLLREARDRALRAGHAGSAIAATNRLADTFAVDAAVLRLEVLTRLKTATLNGESLLALLDYAIALAEERRTAEQYEQAGAALDHALVYANRSRTPKLVAEVTMRRAEVRASQAAFGGYKAALEKLAVAPKDAAANLTAGQFLCLHKGQWDKGLEHLAASGDPAWSAAAKADLARPDDPAELIKVGDAWWELSQKEPAATRKRLIQRSAGWYHLAHPSVSGLQQTKLDKRLQAFTATGLPAISVNGEEVAAAPGAPQPWNRPRPEPWDKQQPLPPAPRPAASSDPLFGNSDRPSLVDDTADKVIDSPGRRPSVTAPPASRRPMPDPTQHRRAVATTRRQLRFSDTIPKPLEGMNVDQYADYLTKVCGDAISQHRFLIPKHTTCIIDTKSWALPSKFEATFKMPFPDGFFGPGPHPQASYDSAKHELEVPIWRDDGDVLPDPSWLYRRFVDQVPRDCAKDPVRVVQLLRRWLDLYHDDPAKNHLVDGCYFRIGAAYEVNGSEAELDALLDAEMKLDRGPRAAYAILIERARHLHLFHKNNAKSIETFEQARAVAKAHAAAAPYFRTRVALVDRDIARMLYASDKARALKYARAYYDDLNHGRHDAMASGRILGNIYEALGDTAAASRLYQEIVDHAYPPHIAPGTVQEIHVHFKNRLHTLARGQLNIDVKDPAKPR